MVTETPKNICSQLNELHELTQEEIEFYKENGFIRLQLLSPEVLAYYETFIADQVNKADKTPLEDDEAYASAFIQVINIWRTNDKVKEFVLGKKLAHIATQLMQVEGIRIYHDQALFKSPGGGATPWHCDQFYWPLDSDKTVTAWVPLVAVPPEMGPLEFAAGSHKEDLGRSVGIGKTSDTVIGEAVDKGHYKVVGGGFQLGEVSFHAGWTFHRANANTSQAERRVMTMIYMDKDIRMTEPVNDNQRADVERYLVGVEVGGVCRGPRNPLAFSYEEDVSSSQQKRKFCNLM